MLSFCFGFAGARFAEEIACDVGTDSNPAVKGFGAPAAAAVPALGTWGFAALALLLAGVAVMRLRAG